MRTNKPLETAATYLWSMPPMAHFPEAMGVWMSQPRTFGESSGSDGNIFRTPGQIGTHRALETQPG